jgi:histidine ammonia-lyase
VLDYLAILMTDLASLCERRLFRLTDGSLNEELPAMLVDDPEDKPGLMSGMMIAQYLAAGIVSDCKTLAHPDSVDSIPTCANQEDHVSMSMNAARHARTVVANAERVAGIELLCAFLALEGRVNQMNERLADREKARKEIADRRKKGEHHLKRQDSLFEAIDSGAVVGIKVGIGTGAAIASIRSTLHGRVGALPEWRVPKGGVADPAGQSS